jgi:hypothetical protein
MPRTPLPMPMGDAAVNPKTGHLTNSWTDFFLQVALLLSQSPQRIGGREWVAQQASLPPTSIATALIGVGMYLVVYSLRIVRAATGSSSISVEVAWMDGGTGVHAVSQTLTSNDVHDILSDTVFVRADTAVGVTVATTYSSTGPTPMLYDLVASISLIA